MSGQEKIQRVIEAVTMMTITQRQENVEFSLSHKFALVIIHMKVIVILSIFNTETNDHSSD